MAENIIKIMGSNSGNIFTVFPLNFTVIKNRTKCKNMGKFFKGPKIEEIDG